MTFTGAFFFVMYYFLSSNVLCASEDIVSVAIITRHGERYPNGPYPGDPLAQYFEKTGYGGLTPNAHLQMYNVGANLRKHFPQLINRNITILKSSDVHRTTETVELILQGMDGPSNLLPQPVTIHTNLDVDDALLNHAGSHCPRRKLEEESDVNLKLIKMSFAGIWAPIANILHVPTQMDTLELFYAMENIFTQFTLKLKMADWATEKLYQRIFKQLNLLYWYSSQLPMESKLSGVFFDELIGQFKKSLESKKVSFLVYGTHDSTLSPILMTLDLWPDRRPAVGEALVFTLKTNGDMEVYYYSQDHVMEKKVLPGCDATACTLADFESAVKQFIPEDWRKDCEIKS